MRTDAALYSDVEGSHPICSQNQNTIVVFQDTQEDYENQSIASASMLSLTRDHGVTPEVNVASVPLLQKYVCLVADLCQ